MNMYTQVDLSFMYNAKVYTCMYLYMYMHTDTKFMAWRLYMYMLEAHYKLMSVPENYWCLSTGITALANLKALRSTESNCL